MKPAWDALGTEYATSSSILVGNVDCTGIGRTLCETNEVRGYPTLKVFHADGSQTTYTRGRSLDELRAFVSDELEPQCDPTDSSGGGGCTERERKFYAKWIDRPSSETSAEGARLTRMLSQPMANELRAWTAVRRRLIDRILAARE